MIAIGAGFLAYGATVEPASYRAPAGIELLGTPSETLAWATGLLVAGLLTLLVFGRRARRDPDAAG